jgi:peptide/nickel transport system ATP-binding protein
VPQLDEREPVRIRLPGEIPTHADPPSGCVFHTRCPRYIGDVCKQEVPPLREVEPGHFWSCHYDAEQLRELQQRPPEERPAAATPSPDGGAAVAPAEGSEP